MKKQGNCRLWKLALLAAAILCTMAACSTEKNVPETTSCTQGMQKDIPYVENGIYSTFPDYDIRLYRESYYRGVSVYVMTEEPLAEDTQVSLDADIPYTVSITEITPTQISEADYPYGIFACTKGENWDDILSKGLEALEAEKKLKNSNSISEDEKAQAQQAIEQYNTTRYRYKEEYRKYIVDEMDKPIPFHLYEVSLNFTNYRGEGQIQGLRIVSENRTYATEKGRISFQTTWPLKAGGEALVLGKLARTGTIATPWSTGRCELQELIQVEAKDNLTITDLYFLDDSAKIIEGYMDLKTASGSAAMQWTPGQKIQMQAGDALTGSLVFSDEALTAADYGRNHYLVLEYESGGETYENYIQLSLFRKRLPYELWFWAFKNTDTQSYYQNYLNPYTAAANTQE